MLLEVKLVFSEVIKVTEKQKELKNSWLQIMAILQETGYYHLYVEDVSRVANVIRKEIGLDK